MQECTYDQEKQYNKKEDENKSCKTKLTKHLENRGLKIGSFFLVKMLIHIL